MTNEEYREYVHTMYKENFLDKGKKPKWIQIFGDSYGHFISEGTWGHELSQLIGCDIVSFASAGANNLRTLSYFHEYYDSECLNIVLVTSPNRLHVKDDLFFLYGADGGLLGPNGAYAVTLTPTQTEKLQKDALSYYQSLHSSIKNLVIEHNFFKQIFHFDNTIFLNCFPKFNYKDEGISDNFKSFYDFNIPMLLNVSLYHIQGFPYRDDIDDKNSVTFENITAPSVVTLPTGIGPRNHLSIKMQKIVAEGICNIIHNATFGNISFNDDLKPGLEEILVDKMWQDEIYYKKKKIEYLNIKLAPLHKKFI